MSNKTPEIETLSTAEVYRNPWMRVREDRIRRADGSDGLYGVVEKPDFAVIAPLENGQCHLVEQFRYPIGARCWEFPQGGWPPGKSGSPIDLARAELREETGLAAGTVEHIGRLHPSYGFSTQRFDVFRATDFTRNEPEREAEEQGMVSRSFPIEHVLDMIRDGKLTDGATIAAIALLQLHGKL